MVEERRRSDPGMSAPANNSKPKLKVNTFDIHLHPAARCAPLTYIL